MEQLQAIFDTATRIYFPNGCSSRHRHQLDDAGRPKDAELVGRLRRQAEGFAAFAENASAAPSVPPDPSPDTRRHVELPLAPRCC